MRTQLSLLSFSRICSPLNKREEPGGSREKIICLLIFFCALGAMLPGETGPDNDQDQTMTTLFGHCLVLKFQDYTTTILFIWSFSGPEILGLHNDVGKIVWSLSGPETPVLSEVGPPPPPPPPPRHWEGFDRILDDPWIHQAKTLMKLHCDLVFCARSCVCGSANSNGIDSSVQVDK